MLDDRTEVKILRCQSKGEADEYSITSWSQEPLSGSPWNRDAQRDGLDCDASVSEQALLMIRLHGDFSFCLFVFADLWDFGVVEPFESPEMKPPD
ncbi:hypothetical protein KSS87_017265 [Heliosperma pusillum]|nr:hypothetical protein KSS87_017265 [Heliosperma pusillum]